MSKTFDDIDKMERDEFDTWWNGIKSKRVSNPGVAAEEYSEFMTSKPVKEEEEVCPTIKFTLNQMGLDLFYKIITDKRYCDNGDYSFDITTNNASAYDYLCH